MTTRQNILIVDDRPENLFTLEKTLEKTECRVIRATNGNDALKATLNHEFALAILDVQMPGMDGYELAEILRGEKRTRHLPLVFISAVYSDDYHIFKGYDAGAVDFIIKPYNPRLLISKINVFLQLELQRNQLSQSKNYIESILMSTADLVIAVSEDDLIETTNPAALYMLGYSPTDFSGMPIENLFDRQEYDEWRRMLIKKNNSKTCSAGQKAISNIETKITTRTGEKIPVLISCAGLCSSGTTQGVVLVAVDITERIRMERRIRTSLKEKEVLLREIHHRVKNTLQVIASMMNLQRDDADTRQPLEILQNCQNRIQTIAMIYDNLYGSNSLVRIDFGEYAKSLTGYLLSSYGSISGPVKFSLDIKNVFLGLDAAIPCGLALNEIITNSLKHAFPHGKGGDVFVRFYSENDRLVLKAGDNGIGIPVELDLKNPSSLGFHFLNIIVEQLDGDLKLCRKGPAEITIRFLKPAPISAGERRLTVQ